MINIYHHFQMTTALGEVYYRSTQPMYMPTFVMPARWFRSDPDIGLANPDGRVAGRSDTHDTMENPTRGPEPDLRQDNPRPDGARKVGNSRYHGQEATSNKSRKLMMNISGPSSDGQTNTTDNATNNTAENRTENVDSNLTTTIAITSTNFVTQTLGSSLNLATESKEAQTLPVEKESFPPTTDTSGGHNTNTNQQEVGFVSDSSRTFTRTQEAISAKLENILPKQQQRPQQQPRHPTDDDKEDNVQESIEINIWNLLFPDDDRVPEKLSNSDVQDSRSSVGMLVGNEHSALRNDANGTIEVRLINSFHFYTHIIMIIINT